MIYNNYVYVDSSIQLFDLDEALISGRRLVAINVDALVTPKGNTGVPFIVRCVSCRHRMMDKGYMFTEETATLWAVGGFAVKDYVDIAPRAKEKIRSLQERQVRVIAVCQAPSGYIPKLRAESLTHLAIGSFFANDHGIHFHDEQKTAMLVPRPGKMKKAALGRELTSLPSIQQGIIYTGKWKVSWAIHQYLTRRSQVLDS